MRVVCQIYPSPLTALWVSCISIPIQQYFAHPSCHRCDSSFFGIPPGAGSFEVMSSEEEVFDVFYEI